MPVTMRIITADSGSSRSVRPAEKSPELIHVNARWTMAPLSGGNVSSLATAAADTANDRSGISSSMSPLQRCERVGVQRLAVAEQPDHNSQADGGFGVGDGHDEKH